MRWDSSSRVLYSLTRSITNLKNEKTQFNVTLKKFLNSHSFYSVDEFFTCTNDMYYWVYDYVNINIFIVCMFMTCSTSYCLVTLKDLWNVYMYVCMYAGQLWAPNCSRRTSFFCELDRDVPHSKSRKLLTVFLHLALKKSQMAHPASAEVKKVWVILPVRNMPPWCGA